MKTKFTPGPWKRHKECTLMIYSGNDNRFVASTLSGGFYNNETHANADFISAAPDLYAALESVEWINSSTDDRLFEEEIMEKRYCPSCENFKTDGHRPNCKLNAALKRANGEK